MAVDYGRKRIGLAISDELGLVARPLVTLERVNRRADIRKLREIVREQGVRKVIVGHALRLDGTAGEMAEETARFARRIRKELGVEVELVDERLTSWAAEELQREAKKEKRGGKRGLDEVAAAVMLREYLERE